MKSVTDCRRLSSRPPSGGRTFVIRIRHDGNEVVKPLRRVSMMVIDFEVSRSPAYTVASILKVGPYREDNLRNEFGELVAWAKENRLRTGKWIMYEHDGPNSRRPGNQRRWEACLEIRGKGKPEGRIRIKKLPAQTVAKVVFNPNVISSRIIYHGLGDWIWWRLKYKDFKRAGPTREVYAGDPWTNEKAWSKVEVQVLVEK